MAYDTPVPGASGYGQAANLANTAYQNALARIAANRNSMLHSYGYLRGADGSLSVDPNNPFGKVQQMFGSQATASDHAADLHRSAGFSSSGYGNAADAQLKQAQGAEAADLGTGLSGSLSDLSDQEQQAAFARDSALYDAEQQAAQQAIQNQEFNPADVSGVHDEYGSDASQAPPGRPRRSPRQQAKHANAKVMRAAMAAARKKKKGGR